MHIIVLDTERLLDYRLEKHFDENKIAYFQTSNPEQALKTYIEDAGIDALVVLMLSEPGAYLIKAISRFHELDATFPVVCLFRNPALMKKYEERFEALNVVCREFDTGEPRLAIVLNALAKDVNHKRKAHRVDCRLQGIVYEHDAQDQKKTDAMKMVSVVSMSSNGAYVAAGEFETDIGTSYLFEITFPDFIFLVKGRVAYIGQADASRPRGFAMQFLEMSQAPQQLLQYMVQQELVDSILKRQGIL